MLQCKRWVRLFNADSWYSHDDSDYTSEDLCRLHGVGAPVNRERSLSFPYCDQQRRYERIERHPRMTLRPLDQHAIGIPRSSGLAPCLYIPVAARDTDAIETYVGRILAPLSRRLPNHALLVEAHDPDRPDERLAIWSHPQAGVLHSTKQVWVHVDYRAYRRAYIHAFPDTDLSDLVLDHVMNRRVARLKGFAYLRIVPISRKANSSHGGLSEGWGVEYHSSPRMRELNRVSKAVVQYADLADVVKMLNIEGGGSFMQNVNEAQKLVDLPKAADQ